MKRFLIMSRSPFFTAIIAPVLLGSLLAWRVTGRFSWLRFVLAMAGAVAAHAGANLANDYFDYRLGADLDNPNRNQFSGGSPHIVRGLEPARRFLAYSFASFVVAFACAVALAWIVDRGWGPVAWLALAGFLCGFFYTATPFKLVYRGFGELVIFIAFGLLPVLGAWYVQAGTLSVVPVVASLPLAFLITNILWINEFPDYESDKAAGKLHLVARLGPARARWGYHAMSAAAFVLIAAFGWTETWGRWAWLGLGGLPLAAGAAATLHRHFADPPALIRAQALTIAAHLVTGLLLCAGLLLAA